MKYTFATLALAAASLANPVPTTSSDAPSSFKIVNVVSGGSGCPQGSIDVNWTDNKIFPICKSPLLTPRKPPTPPLPQHNPPLSNRSLTMYPDFSPAFTARVGSRADATDSRKNCQLNLKLSYDSGFSFSVYSADYTGWADLDSGVTGTVKASYYFSGETEQGSAALSIPGPFHGKYFKQDNVDLAVWSPCGAGEALLNVNSEVSLSPFATSASGVLASTREGGRLVNNLYFAWRKC
jgi:hypothetical protein